MTRHAAPLVDGTQVAALAAELADPTRTTVCLSLLDGRAWTAGELARQAGVARSTLSEHASRLVAAGLLAEERQGRHRYLRLASDDVAALVEALAVRSGTPPRPTSLRASRASEALAAGRTCYDYLAGRLGVDLLEALVARELLDDRDGLGLTASGARWLGGLGVDVEELRRARRPLVRPCLDWTARRPHLGGGVGAALLEVAERDGWIARAEGSRAVALTAAGAERLGREVGLGAI